MSTGPESYDQVVGRTKPAKGERAAVVRYLESDEPVLLRALVESIADDSRVVLEKPVVLVTDRKIIAARSSGGFRPKWEAFTLPFGQLEPPLTVDGVQVAVPTSGRASYRLVALDPGDATRLAGVAGDALRTYRLERMGLSPDLD